MLTSSHLAVGETGASGATQHIANIAHTAGLGTETPYEILSNVINVALGLLGVVFFILILAGGLRWMLSGGDEAKIKSARGLMVNAAIGLAIVLAAYAITTFIINILAQGTGVSSL
jgi:hypothetical protein